MVTLWRNVTPFYTLYVLFFGLRTRWVSWCSLEMQRLTESTETTEGVYVWLVVVEGAD